MRHRHLNPMRFSLRSKSSDSFHDAGLLTDQEFQAKKADLLSRL